MFVKKALLGSVVLLGLASVPANANLIVNGDFENGTFTADGSGITTYDTIAVGDTNLTGWTVGNSLAQSPAPSLAWGKSTTDINPHAGIGFVDLTGVGDTIPHGELDQSISTVIGQQYTFSIFETQDFSSSIVGINVFANGIALALLGTPGFWLDNSGPTAVYGELTGVFTATSTSTPISIRSIKFGSTVYMIGLDDVSVTVSDVPIPAALPLFAAGLGAMGIAGWRKRKAAVAG